LVAVNHIQEDDETSITEKEAWALPQEMQEFTFEPEVKVIRLVRRKSWLTVVHIDLLNGEVMESEALVDSGSVLSFISLNAVRQCAPELLDQVNHYRDTIIGVW